MTTRPPSPSARMSALLSRFPPETVGLAKKSLERLRRVLPGSTQIVYDYSKSVVVSFSMSERGYEGIVVLAISPSQVQLYFDKSIPDPKHLLKGSGSKVRSVSLEAATDVDRGDIADLIKAAIKHSGVKLPAAGAGRVIFKSESKKPKAKKA